MTVTFQFVLNTPTSGQVAQYQIKCYESVTGGSVAGQGATFEGQTVTFDGSTVSFAGSSTTWTLIDTQLVSSFTTTNGITTYVCTPANPVYYHILSPVSAVGVENALIGQPIIPPAIVETSLVTLYVNTSDFGGNIVAGVPFSVAAIPKQTFFSPQQRALINTNSTTTNSAGYAALYILSDIGNVRITLGPKSFVFNTAGLGGTAINMNTLISGATF